MTFPRTAATLPDGRFRVRDSKKAAVFRARFHPEWTGFAQNPLLFSRVFSVFVRYRDFTISLSAHQASSPT